MTEINWGLIDTNTPAKVANSFYEGQQNALARMNAMQSQQLNALNLRKATLDAAGDEQARNAFAQNPGDTQKAVESITDPLKRMQYQKLINEQKKSQADTEITLHKVRLNTASEVASAGDDNILQVAQQTALKNAKMFGTDPSPALAHIQQLYDKGGPQALRQESTLAALDAKDKLMKFEQVDLGGQKLVGTFQPATGVYDLQPMQKTVTPGEIMTDRRVRDNSQLKIDHGISGLTPEENEALFGQNGAITTGRLDPARVNSKTAKLFAQGELLNPGGNDFVAKTGDAAINRNAPFRVKAMTAEVLPEVMGNMVEAGKKLNYPDAKFAGVVKQWAMGQVNDPDLTSYMTQRNDALMSIASVMRGNGMTDMAHKAEVEASNPTMSPRALDAWLEAQNKALAPRLKQNAKYTHSDRAVNNQQTPAQQKPQPQPTGQNLIRVINPQTKEEEVWDTSTETRVK